MPPSPSLSNSRLPSARTGASGRIWLGMIVRSLGLFVGQQLRDCGEFGRIARKPQDRNVRLVEHGDHPKRLATRDLTLFCNPREMSAHGTFRPDLNERDGGRPVRTRPSYTIALSQ